MKILCVFMFKIKAKNMHVFIFIIFNASNSKYLFHVCLHNYMGM